VIQTLWLGVISVCVYVVATKLGLLLLFQPQSVNLTIIFFLFFTDSVA